MTAFLSGEPVMYEAYNTGKDLYAMIAQAAFDNNYEDNLEFWPEGTELEIEGKKVIAGNEKTYEKALTEDNSITIKYFYLVPTPNGDIQADQLKIGDLVCSSTGDLKVKSVETIEGQTTISFCE